MSNNPQAFPSRWSVTTATGTKLEDHEPGMTLRDWFAGQALVGFMADPSVTGTEDQIAGRCYRYADAMLKTRGQS